MIDSTISPVDVAYDGRIITADIVSRNGSRRPVYYQDMALIAHNHPDLERLVLRWGGHELRGVKTADKHRTEVPACRFKKKRVIIETQNPKIYFRILQAKITRLCRNDPGYGSEYDVIVYFELSPDAEGGQIRAFQRQR